MVRIVHGSVMAKSKQDVTHFLHITKRKHKKQYKKLKKLFRHNEFLIDVKKPLKERQMQKYWKFKHNLFSKINSSPIYMTHELWFSVTPEMIAIFLARFIKACLPNATKVMDVFCGGGGNTIQLAKVFPKVYGVDFSLEHLYCTYQNAKAYDVVDRMWLKHGSWPDMVAKGRITKLGLDCVFGSPPWGGPQYLSQDEYDLENSLQPTGITEMLRGMLTVSQNVIMFLPKNSNLKQLARATRKVQGVNAKCKVVYVKQNGFMKGILCMWGDALTNYEEAIDDDIDIKNNVVDVLGSSEDKGKAKKIIVSYAIDG